MTSCHGFINDGRLEGGVLVVSFGTPSRAAALVASYIIRTSRITAEEALARLASKHAELQVPVNPGFLQELDEFAAKIQQNASSSLQLSNSQIRSNPTQSQEQIPRATGPGQEAPQTQAQPQTTQLRSANDFILPPAQPQPQQTEPNYIRIAAPKKVPVPPPRSPTVGPSQAPTFSTSPPKNQPTFAPASPPRAEPARERQPTVFEAARDVSVNCVLVLLTAEACAPRVAIRANPPPTASTRSASANERARGRGRSCLRWVPINAFISDCAYWKSYDHAWSAANRSTSPSSSSCANAQLFQTPGYAAAPDLEFQKLSNAEKLFKSGVQLYNLKDPSRGKHISSLGEIPIGSWKTESGIVVDRSNEATVEISKSHLQTTPF